MEEIQEQESVMRSIKLEKAVEDFINHLESLADTYPLLTTTLRGTSLSATKQFNDFLMQECVLVDEDESSYRVPFEKQHKRERLKRKIGKTKLAEGIVPRSFIVSLVSEFDSYLGQLIKVIFYLRPELLNASEKNISFPKLLELGSIEEGREFIIEKEIETVLRDSHIQMFRWLENKLDVKLTTDLKSWEKFIELTERRNLFVHNNGVVNRQYLSVCKSNNVGIDQTVNIGDVLEITNSYFENAYRCVFEIGIKLSQVIWRKFIKDEIEEADSNIMGIVFDQILRKDYSLAIELAEFSTHKVIKHFNKDYELTCIINKAQAYKWNKNNDKCIEIVTSIDWSACSDKFKLVSSVLLDNFQEAVNVMRKLGKDDEEITKIHYREWPIFQEFILSPIFLDTYKEIFGLDFISWEQEDKLAVKS